MAAIVFPSSMRPHIACNTNHHAGKVKNESVIGWLGLR
jgi:hypothetical protein